MAGGTYASTSLIACRRTAFPLNGVLSSRAPATVADADRPTVGTFDGQTCYARVKDRMRGQFSTRAERPTLVSWPCADEPNATPHRPGRRPPRLPSGGGLSNGPGHRAPPRAP